MRNSTLSPITGFRQWLTSQMQLSVSMLDVDYTPEVLHGGSYFEMEATGVKKPDCTTTLHQYLQSSECNFANDPVLPLEKKALIGHA